jgi:hypothetical protein
MVSRLARGEPPVHFVTGTSATCTSVFKPVWLDAGLPWHGPRPGKRYDHESLFWRHERLHRAVLSDYAARIALFRRERDALEAGFVGEAVAHEGATCEARHALSQACFDAARDAEERFLGRVLGHPVAARRARLHARAWRAFDEAAGMPSPAR